MADIWVPLRAGTDILFLGGLIHYALENDKYFREYVQHYTNAPMIIREDFRDTEDLGGIFSGWNEQKKKYSPESWLYEGSKTQRMPAATSRATPRPKAVTARTAAAKPARPSEYEADPTLQHPRCVFQILRRHFSRYTPELIERHAGVPQKLFLKVAEAFCNASGPEKTGAICYAVGWTQHSKGVQIIRSAAILQLLLGNIGRPGGGILALRGHASIQGSTDIPTLYDILPGYLAHAVLRSTMPMTSKLHQEAQSRRGLWSNFDKLLRQPDEVLVRRATRTAENNWGFDYMPRVTGDHSHFGYWLDMQDGKMEGLFVMGQNPAVGAPNARLQRTAMSKLKWLVVRDMVEIESASWWYNSPEVEARRAEAGRRSRPKSSCSPPPARPRRTVARPTPSGWCNTATRQSIRPATRAAKPGSCITWRAA